MEYAFDPKFVAAVSKAYGSPVFSGGINAWGEMCIKSEDRGLCIIHPPCTNNWEVDQSFCDKKVFIELNDTETIIKTIEENNQRLSQKIFKMRIFVNILKGKFDIIGIKNYIHTEKNRCYLGLIFGENDSIALERKSLLAFSPNEIRFWLKDESGEENKMCDGWKTYDSETVDKVVELVLERLKWEPKRKK